MTDPLTMVQQLCIRGAIAPTRLKDVKTALNKLADATRTPIEQLDLAASEATYKDTLTNYFAQLSPPASRYTQRNTFQNLAQLYRAAHAAGLLTAAVPPRQKRPAHKGTLRELADTSPYYSHSFWHLPKDRQRYGIPEEQWPPEIARCWRAYRAERAVELRPRTLVHYDQLFRACIGYHLLIAHPPLTTLDQLFDPMRLAECVQWLAQRVAEPNRPAPKVTGRGKLLVWLVSDIARQRERPEYAALKNWRSACRTPCGSLIRNTRGIPLPCRSLMLSARQS